MATSYSIVRNHDGHIEVESRPGAGTTFTFYPAQVGRRTQAVAAGRGGASKGKGRVLVMDDDGMILKFVAVFSQRSVTRPRRLPRGQRPLPFTGKQRKTEGLLMR